MKKYIIYSLFLCALSLVNISCEDIFDELEDFYTKNDTPEDNTYCWVSVEFGNNDSYLERNIKVEYDGQVYNALGRYKVPVGSVVKLTWEYQNWDMYRGEYVWTGKASREIMATSNMLITINNSMTNITYQ